MGLKPKYDILSSNAFIGLKSDHYGIETIKEIIMILDEVTLKSDHYGIETEDTAVCLVKTVC